MGGKLPPYAVAESDGNPVVYQPWKIIFPNGTVNDVGDGTVYIKIGTSIETTTSITVSSYDVRTPVLVAGTVLYFLTNGAVGQFLNGAGGYTSVYDARTPLLSAGTVLSIQTDGTITNYLRGDGTYHSVYEARSPLLSAGTILSIQTDGTTTNYLRGDGTYRSVYDARSPLFSAGTVLSILTNGAITDYLRGDGTYRSVYEARSPLLSAGTVLSILTDGATANFLRGDGTFAVPSSNSGIKCAVFTIGSDASWDSEAVPVFQAPYDTPITLRRITASVIGSTTSQLIFNLDMRVATSLNAVGETKVFASNQSAVTAGFSATSFSSANIPALMYLVLSTPASAASGVPNIVTGSIFYTRDSI